MTPPPTLQELIETVRQDSGSDLPLDQLVAAAAAAAQLEETTDALLGYFVDRCRRDGRSWTEISSALGVTKQAVHKRFAAALAGQIVAANPAPTFERFTDRARRVVIAAQQAAVDRAGSAVNPEHVLLALFTEPDGLAARALAQMAVTEELVRDAVAAAGDGGSGDGGSGDGGSGDGGSGAGADPSPAGEPSQEAGAGPAATTRQPLPFSDAARRVLTEALTVALRFGHNYIGTEHLLLGIYRDPDSLATQILASAGALESTARAHIADMLRGFRQGG